MLPEVVEAEVPPERIEDAERIDEKNNEQEEPESIVMRVARLMVKHRNRLLKDQDIVAGSVGISRRHLMRTLSAIAEDTLARVLDYVELSRAGQWIPLLFQAS